jgi:translation elongation factor P/translation initiation factor 5A
MFPLCFLDHQTRNELNNHAYYTTISMVWSDAMKNLLTILLLSSALFAGKAKAAAWEDTQTWSLEYEAQYSQFLQSNAVRENMFKNAGSPYNGVNTDCADTAYAMRAIFAFENKLPFAIKSPSGGKPLTNRSTKWDSRGPEVKRVIAMINEIGESVGTENLALFDTYPVALKSIVPGSLFMYKISKSFGRFIRHTYVIKDINPIGTFDVIYSTQANKEQHLPLIRRRDREFENLPFFPWGFKRFRWPEHIGKELSAIPAEMGPSMEQYQLASSLGHSGFFKLVKKTVASASESAGQRVARTFKAACSESQARIDYVNQGLIYLGQTGNKCMDYEHFDAYSTPQRDADLKELYLKYKAAYDDAVALGETASIDPQIMAFTEYIFKAKLNGSVKDDLLAACPIAYRPGMTIDIQTLWTRINKGLLSSHPNDIVEVRWGEKTTPKTKCKRWY